MGWIHEWKDSLKTSNVCSARPHELFWKKRLIVVIEKDSFHEIKVHKMVFLLIIKQSTKSFQVLFRAVVARLKICHY